MIIKSFKLFESNSISNIDQILLNNNIEIDGNFKINKDGSLNVDGSVTVRGSIDMVNLPVRFEEVSSNFIIRNSVKADHLRGCPKYVGGSFECSMVGVSSLEGGPRIVNGYYDCGGNLLTSLRGCPEEVNDFYCSGNILKSIDYYPSKNGGDFYCAENQLTSFEGFPEFINGDFDCSHNHITSFSGSLRRVKGVFDCCFNKITSLDGAPICESEFLCAVNDIVDCGSSEISFESMNCTSNPFFEIWNMNPRLEFIHQLIECQVIRDGNKIVEKRLVRALEDSNGKVPSEFKFKSYSLI